MAKYKILLVGCGQLGSRHLQAVASIEDIAEIHVVDPNPASIELGKTRLKEIPDLNRNPKFYWFNELNRCSAQGDLCLIATQARGRGSLLKRVARELNYKAFLIEKVVVQSLKEYEDLILFSEQNNLSVWVNCKTRAYSIHKYIKSRLNQDEPIMFTRIEGNHGLAGNGIHGADLFVFYDGADRIRSGSSRIDPVLHPSKRGQNLFELSGTVHGFTDKGSDLVLSFARYHLGPDCISIVSPRGRFIIDHFQKTAFESYPQTDWAWSPIRIDENWLVSHMTKKFVSDIFNHGACDLPTLKECYPAHKYILSELLPHFNRLLGVSEDYCPVT